MMNQVFCVALMVAALCSTSACTNLQAQPFVSTKTEVYAVKHALRQPAQVAPFTAERREETSIMCRGGGISIALPENQTFPHYLEDGMRQMLAEADRYDPQSAQVIHGHIQKVDFDSITGNWEFSGTFSVGKKTVSLDKDYPYPNAFGGKEACENAVNAFNIAAAHFVSDVLGALSKG
jgi:hypothetical protein